jgi:hypothetical protein
MPGLMLIQPAPPGHGPAQTPTAGVAQAPVAPPEDLTGARQAILMAVRPGILVRVPERGMK